MRHTTLNIDRVPQDVSFAVTDRTFRRLTEIYAGCDNYNRQDLVRLMVASRDLTRAVEADLKAFDEAQGTVHKPHDHDWAAEFGYRSE